MKNYRLAVDENGSPFVLNSKGSIDFGYITEEMNLPAAPIRVAEGNDNYGLTHIELRHGEQLRNNGFNSAYEFIEKSFLFSHTLYSAKQYLPQIKKKGQPSMFVGCPEDYYTCFSKPIFLSKSLTVKVRFSYTI